MTVSQLLNPPSPPRHRAAVERLQAEQPVYTNDGFHLGYVGGVDRARQLLRVEAAGAAPLWIPLECIGAACGGYVLLCRTRAQVLGDLTPAA